MNKTFKFAAMALPLLFAACSQDELIENVGAGNMSAPGVKGYSVTLAPTLSDDTEGTRANWSAIDKKLEWEPNKDLISVYWLDNQEANGTGTNGNLKGMYNTIFKTTDGSSFSSEALVFQGGNIAVYPANTSFTTQGDIFLSVPTKQTSETIKNLPYVSNYFVAGEWLDKNISGYQNGIYAPVKMAANVLTLQLDLANTAELTEKFNFEVQSVSLVSDVDATFAEKAALKIDGTPNDKGMAYQNRGSSIQTIKKSVRVAGIPSEKVLTTTDITKNSEGNYTVKFVVLPTKVTGMAAASTIVIETNCGTLTLQTKVKGNAVAELFKDKDGNILVANGGAKAETKDLAGVVYNGSKSFTIAELFKSLVSAYVHSANATDGSNFKGEMIGGHYSRSIAGDMADATLDNSKVYSEDDVVRYTNIHASMNSKLAMNLILSDNDGDGIWSISNTSFNAIGSRRTAGADVTMSLSTDDNEEVTKLQLLGGGNEYFNADNQWKGVADNSLVVILEAGKEWTLNTNTSRFKIGQYINQGTLTLNNVRNTSLVEKVVNEGTIKLGSNVVSVGTNLENTAIGKVEVAAEQDLRFDKDVTSGLAGEINVAANAYMTINQDINVTSEATINNSGTVSSIAGNGGLVNEGTINVKDAAAITYVQDNTNGVINLLNRHDEVKVEGNKGKIVYNYDSAVDGSKFERVTSDKFTYVVFGKDKEQENITLNESDISDISIEFVAKSTTLKTNSDDITKLVVAENAELKLLTPSETYDNVLFVEDLVNNGNITIGGKIFYSGTFNPQGVVRSVGNGAIIFNAEEAISNLEAAIAEGGEVSLVADLTLTETLKVEGEVELNMDGNEIAGDIEVAAGADLTVENGTISNENSAVSGIVSNGNLTLDNVTVESARHALRIESGETVINGGTYSVIGDPNMTQHALNVGEDATKTANVTINGGTFIGAKNTGADSGAAVVVKDGSTVTINDGTFYNGLNNTLVVKDGATMIIKGGKFDQDPSTYVADGYVATESNGWWIVSAE